MSGYVDLDPAKAVEIGNAQRSGKAQVIADDDIMAAVVGLLDRQLELEISRAMQAGEAVSIDEVENAFVALIREIESASNWTFQARRTESPRRAVAAPSDTPQPMASNSLVF